MKYKNVFWGLILIIIGGLAIGRNLDLIYFDWYSFLKLWPVIFILWGISVLPMRDPFKIGLLVLVLGGATWFVTHAPSNRDRSGFEYLFDYSVHDSDWSSFKGAQTFNIPFNDSIETASVNFDAAAGSFYMKDTTNDLLDLRQTGNRENYKYFVEQKGTHSKIEISERRNHVYLFNSKHREVYIKLNSKPVWDINLNAGASQLNFDLSPYKVKSFDMDGGAGSFDVTLGNLYPDTRVTLDAGASSITLRVPESSGCDLQLSSVLSDKNMSGFHKLGDGHYQTDNYDSAKNKIHLNIDAAVSSFTIIRY
ncbi:MAG: hypothetical protein IH595_05115 [Bacteroidales bacterium]|nr:hypothetical protein [Bacteroidales bacterium]